MATNIILKGGEFQIRREALAAEAGIKPGHVLSIDTAGHYLLNDFINTAGATATDAAESLSPLLWIAVEEDFLGKGADDAASTYADNDMVQAVALPRGAEVVLRAAVSQNFAIGDFVELAAAGQIVEFTNDTDIGIPVGVALTANASTSADDPITVALF